MIRPYRAQQLADWLIAAARDAAMRGRPVPPCVIEHIRDLRQAGRMSDTGRAETGPAIIEVSTDEAARILGCTPRHVRRLCQAGRLSARRAGRRAWMITLNDLTDYDDYQEADAGGSRGPGPRRRTC